MPSVAFNVSTSGQGKTTRGRRASVSCPASQKGNVREVRLRKGALCLFPAQGFCQTTSLQIVVIQAMSAEVLRMGAEVFDQSFEIRGLV